MPKSQNCKTIVIPSQHTDVCCVCERILSEVKAYNFSQDDIFSIHLAIEDAMINAVKHGNKADSSKKVKVEYSIDSEKFDVSIFDEGTGFDPHSVPDPRDESNLLKASGRGLLLMKSYMDVVEYSPQGNCVHMTKFRHISSC